MSEHSFGKSRSVRRNESANGAVNVDVAVDSCEGGIADEVGADAGVKNKATFCGLTMLHLHGVRVVLFQFFFLLPSLIVSFQCVSSPEDLD